MAKSQTIEVEVQGMDCTECTLHVQHAIAALPGVESVDVLLATEKAIIHLDPTLTNISAIRKAVEGAGYTVPEATKMPVVSSPLNAYTRKVLILFGILFCLILFVVVVVEWLGFFKTYARLVPWPVGLAIVLIAGYPIFFNVIRTALKGRIISHTLMCLGVLAALLVGQWATAVVIVFFMRVGDYTERFTTERARTALKNLNALAPQLARVERDGAELQVPIGEVGLNEIVIVRPGEQIPVDGEVISGQATVNQATIIGEPMPIEVSSGMSVFASTYAQLGVLRIRVTHVGGDSTFGRIIRMVEQAEAQRANIQRIADTFAAYYLPVVAGIALLTLMLRHDPLSSAAVLVVACSCSFTLATPIAMLASIGAAAKRGLLIKGGKYLEMLVRKARFSLYSNIERAEHMDRNIRGMFLLVLVLCLLAACGSTANKNTTMTNNSHLSDSVAPGISCVTPVSGLQAFRIVSDRSQASYQVREQALSQMLPLNTVVGKTRNVTGEFLLTSERNLAITSLKVIVDLRTLSSGEDQRDKALTDDYLETSKFTSATFTASDVQVIANDYRNEQDKEIAFKLNGNLTLHGTTRPATFDLQGKLKGDTISGSATSLIHMKDFGVEPPNIVGVVAVQNDVTLTLEFVAQKENCMQILHRS